MVYSLTFVCHSSESMLYAPFLNISTERENFLLDLSPAIVPASQQPEAPFSPILLLSIANCGKVRYLAKNSNPHLGKTVSSMVKLFLAENLNTLGCFPEIFSRWKLPDSVRASQTVTPFVLFFEAVKWWSWLPLLRDIFDVLSCT